MSDTPVKIDPEIPSMVKALLQRSEVLDKETIDLKGRLVTALPDSPSSLSTKDEERSYVAPLTRDLGAVLNNINIAIGLVREMAEEIQL